jgi:DNA-binding CsgD family transcriptional regulator
VFQRLTAHLGSAYRCRRRLRGEKLDAVEGSEAILRPDGRVLDARGPAESTSARTALTDAVRAMERVRRRRNVDATAEHWRPRIKARWTLVDSPEGDRDRYVLARENQLEPRGLEVLTERERQVVACVAAGRTVKELAYELGISYATARVLLARAYARLGVASREELFGLKSIRGLRGEPTPESLP